MDKSNGYEEHSAFYIAGRGRSVDGVGTSAVRRWARTLPAGATVLDLGCGTGKPVSQILTDEGMTVYGIDASPSMVEMFRQNFPANPVACEAVEDSSFFNRQFDAVIFIGLIFLLTEKTQEILLQKAANALNIGGKLLFTSPTQIFTWDDAITLQKSVSLGAERYKELLTASGLSVIEEFEDEGENHYYHAVRH